MDGNMEELLRAQEKYGPDVIKQMRILIKEYQAANEPDPGQSFKWSFHVDGTGFVSMDVTSVASEEGR